VGRTIKVKPPSRLIPDLSERSASSWYPLRGAVASTSMVRRPRSASRTGNGEVWAATATLLVPGLPVAEKVLCSGPILNIWKYYPCDVEVSTAEGPLFESWPDPSTAPGSHCHPLAFRSAMQTVAAPLRRSPSHDRDTGSVHTAT
jgi:hypothetical protein